MKFKNNRIKNEVLPNYKLLKKRENKDYFLFKSTEIIHNGI